MSPLQPGWPQSQAISAASLCDSQYVLQYFSSVMQVQAGWAHFFLSAIKSFLLQRKPVGHREPVGDPSPWMQTRLKTVAGTPESADSGSHGFALLSPCPTICRRNSGRLQFGQKTSKSPPLFVLAHQLARTIVFINRYVAPINA